MTKSRASASLGGALRAESSEGVLRVIFSGEWKRDLLGPNFFTERDEALRETERLLKEARSVELLGEALGEGDSGVLVVTTRLVTLAKEHNIPLDDARLPEGIRNLTKLALAVPRTPPRSVRPKRRPSSNGSAALHWRCPAWHATFSILSANLSSAPAGCSGAALPARRETSGSPFRKAAWTPCPSSL
ncbi:MAG: hypothetical protein ACLSAH_15125 [Bilophila wadsworthia]